MIMFFSFYDKTVKMLHNTCLNLEPQLENNFKPDLNILLVNYTSDITNAQTMPLFFTLVFCYTLSAHLEIIFEPGSG